LLAAGRDVLVAPAGSIANVQVGRSSS